jgi:hypothetical protein
MSYASSSDVSKQSLRVLLALCFIFCAAALRILPHPWNFTPIGAMALFSGAKLGRSWLAFLFPLSALFLGDLFVGFYSFLLIVYSSFALNVLIGTYVRNRQNILSLSAATLLGAAQFFLISNFAIWAFGFTPYPKTLPGLLACYFAGVRFWGNTLSGDAFYGLVLFGGFALAERFLRLLRASKTQLAA